MSRQRNAPDLGLRSRAANDLTEQEALAEAIRRWGPRASVRLLPAHGTKDGRGRLARYRCIVSNGETGAFRAVEGQGNTWREAFDDARLR